MSVAVYKTNTGPLGGHVVGARHAYAHSHLQPNTHLKEQPQRSGLYISPSVPLNTIASFKSIKISCCITLMRVGGFIKKHQSYSHSCKDFPHIKHPTQMDQNHWLCMSCWLTFLYFFLFFFLRQRPFLPSFFSWKNIYLCNFDPDQISICSLWKQKILSTAQD